MKEHKRSSLKRTAEHSREPPPVFVSPAFLLPEEKVIFKTNPHWLYVVVPEVALTATGTLIVSHLPYLLPEGLPPLYYHWVPVLMEAGLVFAKVVIFLYWLCVRYYLTNLRLIEERGIIGKRAMSIWLDKVQDVTCSFGILGRIFGFGDLEIESAGTYGKIVFDFLPAPRKLKDKIEKAVQEFRQRKV